VRMLLDTHALLWWLSDDPALSPRARKAMATASNVVLVSAASAWEIATKARLGRLPGAEELAADFRGIIGREGFTTLDVTVDHGIRAGLLPGPHKDPFDRMLIAQAQAENLPSPPMSGFSRFMAFAAFGSFKNRNNRNRPQFLFFKSCRVIRLGTECFCVTCG
jgi:PIN domain nuclease of toxin-antitoxin system